MKRTMILVLTLALLCACAPAFAAGGLSSAEETWYVLPHSSDYRVFFYGTVENGGSKPETINDLLFEIQSADGTAIESTTKYSLYPEVLEPGQTGLLVITQDVKDIERKSLIDHYSLILTSKSVTDEAAVALNATSEFLAEDEDENENVLRATISNATDDNAFKITAAIAARDADGKLLYIASAATKDIGLAPNGSMLVRAMMNSDVADALKDAGTEVASTEAIAYTMIDIDD